jgi:copper chaperone
MKIRLNVEGMSCSHCENAVKNALNSIKGVNSADVSLQEKAVNIEYDSSKVTIDSIKEAIEDQGYIVK